MQRSGLPAVLSRAAAPSILGSRLGAASAILSLAMAIGGLPVLAAESAAPDPLAARLREYIDQAAAAGFSGVVLVAAGNAQLLHVARGFADFELSVPFSTDHILRIGSLTKPITASAVLRLVERGEIDLKASVCR